MKKLFSKGLIWLLLVSVVTTGMGSLLPEAVLDALRLISIARAETAGIPAAFSLEEQALGEEQASGPWRYALREEDGYAVIAGYDGASVSELELPAELDGADVVGIEAGVLEIAGLRHVYLHGNVLYIADGAFGSAEPIIHALNGSYALYWADARGYAYENESEGTLMPGVIDYTDAASGRVVRRGENHVVLNRLEAMRLDAGDIFWFVDGRGLQYFYRVKSLTSEGRRVVAAVEVPELDDAVIEMHYEGAITATAADFIPADGVDVERGPETYDIFTDEGDSIIHINKFVIGAEGTLKDIAGLFDREQKAKSEVSLEGDIVTQIFYKYDVIDGQTVYAEVITEKDFHFTASYSKGFQDSTLIGDKSFDIFKTKKSLGRIAIGTPIIQFNFEVQFNMEITGTVEGEIIFSAITKEVYDEAKGDWVVERSAQDPNFALTGTLEGKVYFEGKATLTFVGIVAALQFSLEIGVKAELKTGYSTFDPAAICTGLTIIPYARAVFWTGVWLKIGSFEGGAKLTIFDESISFSDKAAGLHICAEGVHLQKDCPYGKRVNVTFVTRTDAKLNAVAVNRNECMADDPDYNLPDHPTAGRHLGWTSSLEGKKADWVFGANGSIVQEATTLYAVWEHSALVEFNSGEDATPMGSQWAPVGGYAVEPEMPSKKGETFRYWYTLDENDVVDKWFFDWYTVPEEGLTLHALWTDGEIAQERGLPADTMIGSKDASNGGFGDPVSSAVHFTYEIVSVPNGGELGVTITGLTGKYTNVTVPSYLYIPVLDELGETITRKARVVNISRDAFQYNRDLMKVTINLPDITLTTPGLFYGCTSLEYVNLVGTNVPAIPDSMFGGCRMLRGVLLPKGVWAYGDAAFKGCKNMTENLIPYGIEQLGGNTFEGCTGIEILDFPASLTKIGDSAFADSTGIRSLNLLESLAEIGESAFENCSGIENLMIPASVKQVGSRAFYGCSGIKNLFIADGVIAGEDAFTNCTGVETVSRGTGSMKGSSLNSPVLKEVVIRGTVKIAVDDAFANDKYWTGGAGSGSASARLVFEEGVERINDFRDCDLFTEVVLPDSLNEIWQYAFKDCDGLRSVYIPDGVAEIGSYAFESCDNLTSVHIPAGISRLGGTFEDCIRLEEVQIPGNVKAVSGAFARCTGLKRLELGEGVEELGRDAFVGCRALRELYLPDSLKTLDRTAFFECTGLERISIGGIEKIRYGMLITGSRALKELVIRGSVKEIGSNAFNSTYGYDLHESRHGSYAGYAGYDTAATDARLIIEEGVERIGDKAFLNCNVFTEVVLPESLVEIGWGAFQSCSRLAKVNLPKNLRVLGSFAFNNCTRLKEIEVPGSVEVFESGVFAYCTGLERVTLCEGITELGSRAFENCESLREVYIPDSVGKNSDAFWNCTNLEKISIGGVDSLALNSFRPSIPALRELIIRGTVREIADGSIWMDGGEYEGAASTRMEIQEGVQRIGAEAFYNCTFLEEVIIPESMAEIAGNAFYNCNGIRALHIGKAQPVFGEGAFCGCGSMTVYVDAANSYALDYFKQLNIPTVAVNEGEPISAAVVCHANGGVFADGSSRMNLELSWQAAMPELPVPEYAGHIFSGWYLDAECTQRLCLDVVPLIGLELYAGWDMDLHTLTLHGNGGSILRDGDAADSLSFSALKDSRPADGIVARKDGMAFAGWYLDAECTKPFDGVMPGEDIELYASFVPESAYGDYTFENGEAKLVAYSLIEGESPVVTLPETVEGMPLTGIGAYAFNGEKITGLRLPSGLASMDANALAGMDELTEIRVHPDNAVYADRDGVLFSRDGSELKWYPARHNAGYRLPEGVKRIAAHAFENSCIRSIILNDGLTEIGEYAFAETALSGVKFPAGLEEIGRCAFYGCGNIDLIEGSANLTEIGELAFYGCGSPVCFYGPVEDCALKQYADANGSAYNMYPLTLHCPDGTVYQRIAQAGSTLNLPKNPPLEDCTEFNGWYKDVHWTLAWTEDDVMPQGELTLYGYGSPIYNYIWEKVSGESGTQTYLILTYYLSDEPVAVVPEDIHGMIVIGIYVGCFGEHVTDVYIPDGIFQIGGGAFANPDVRIHCSEGSGAEMYAKFYGYATGKLSHTVSFVTNGGAEIAALTLEEDTKITLPVPVRSGCEAAGWYLDAELTEAVALDENGQWTVPRKDVTLYAAWNVADESLMNPGFTYEQNSGGITVTGLAAGTTELVIPETLHGLPVTAMEASAFRGEQGLVSVRLPGSIASVPVSAFRGCTALESVTLAEGVREIQANAFYGCAALKELALPDSLTAVKAAAFANSGLVNLYIGAGFSLMAADALNNCAELESIAVAQDNPYFHSVDGVLYDLVDAKLVKYPAGRSGTEYAVDANCYAIGANAFREAKQLETVILHEDIWELGEGAFYGCSALKELPELPGSYLAAIPAACFMDCDGLTEIEIPANIEVIDKNAFASCSKLTKAIVPETVVYIGGGAFPGSTAVYGSRGSAAQEYAEENGLLFVDPDTVLPEGITIAGSAGMLERGAVMYLTAKILPENASLTDVYWSSSDSNVLRIDGDGKVRAIALGNAVISAWTENGLCAKAVIEVYTGEGMPAFLLPAGLKEIKEEAFAGLPVRIVTVPEGANSIGARAFANCANLYRINLPESVQEIAADAFAGCDHLTICAPEGSCAQTFAEAKGIPFLAQN